jgi:hypothetical protein
MTSGGDPVSLKPGLGVFQVNPHPASSVVAKNVRMILLAIILSLSSNEH